MNIVPGMHGPLSSQVYMSVNTVRERSVAAFFLYGDTKNRKWKKKKKKKKEGRRRRRREEKKRGGFPGVLIVKYFLEKKKEDSTEFFSVRFQ